MSPADRRRKAEIGKSRVVEFFERLAIAADEFSQRGRSSRRDRQDMRRLSREALRLVPRSLFENDMRVGAADPQGIDARPPRPIGRRPVQQAVVHIKGAVGEVDPRIGRLEVKRRRDLFVIESQSRLDEPGDARGDLQMADVGLYRSDGAITACGGQSAKAVGNRSQFNRIAERRPCSVGLDETDGARIDTRSGQSLRDDGRHSALAGSHIADFARAIVVDRGAFDHRENVVAVGNRLVQPFEQDQARSVPEDGPLGRASKARQCPSGETIMSSRYW